MSTQTQPDLAILVPVLHRPHRVVPLLQSAAAATPRATLLFVCSPGDDEQIRTVRDIGANFVIHEGSYAKKINHAVRITDEPLLFFGADDIHFHPGWLEAAKARLTDGIGVVGTNDLLRRRREHSTHFLATRKYAERGTVDGPGPLCELYDHSFVDDELIATAKRREAYAYAPDAIVEHIHWMNARADDDETYKRGRARFRLDRKLFARRQRLWS